MRATIPGDESNLASSEESKPSVTVSIEEADEAHSLAEPSELEGEMLGKYHLKRHLATGGMAEIYLAERLGPEGFAKEIVIKRILPHLARDRNFTAMFLDEARLAANLNHPNIGQIHELGEVDGNYYIAMEYIDGASLEQIINSDAVIPHDVAARIVADVLQALDFAHESRDRKGNSLNLVHRDVTPSNVMVSIDGIVKLVDFGVAKAAKKGHKTQTGAVKGKFAYMAPEQVESQDIDRRADIFAIGIVFYELLTGERPFGEDLAAVSRILHQDAKDPRELAPSVPESFARVVLRALQKDVDVRYPSAHNMLLDIETALRRVNSYAGPREIGRVVRSYRGDPSSDAVALAIADTGVFAADRSGEMLPSHRDTEDGANVALMATAAMASSEQWRNERDAANERREAVTKVASPSKMGLEVEAPDGAEAAKPEPAKAPSGPKLPTLTLSPRAKRVIPLAAGGFVVFAAIVAAAVAWGGRERPSSLVTSDPRTVVLNTEPLQIDGADPAALFQATGSTVVIASIPSTKIYVDETFVGWTPFQTQLGSGRYEIDLVHEDTRKSAEFTVGDDVLNRVEFDFVRLGEKSDKPASKRERGRRSLRSKLNGLLNRGSSDR